MFNVAAPAVAIWVAAHGFFLVAHIKPLASNPQPILPLLVPILVLAVLYFLLIRLLIWPGRWHLKKAFQHFLYGARASSGYRSTISVELRSLRYSYHIFNRSNPSSLESSVFSCRCY